MKMPHEIKPVFAIELDDTRFHALIDAWWPSLVKTIPEGAEAYIDPENLMLFIADGGGNWFIKFAEFDDLDAILNHLSTMQPEEVLYCGMDLQNTGMPIEDRLMVA